MKSIESRLYSKSTLRKAQNLRHNQTEAENLLWYYLRKKQLGGFKFRRQQPIGKYIVDFVCMPEGLMVEVDGGQHNTEIGINYDQAREVFLKERGFRILRFWNNDIFKNCSGVLEIIYSNLKSGS